MVVCKYFLQGTCKFGSKCFNQHIQNNNFPIYRNARGAQKTGRSRLPPSQYQHQESAAEYYGRMEHERMQSRQQNSTSRVSSSARNTDTNSEKACEKSNGYSKTNGLSDGFLSENHQQHFFATQDSDSVEISSAESYCGHEVYLRSSQSPVYTEQRRRARGRRVPGKKSEAVKSDASNEDGSFKETSDPDDMYLRSLLPQIKQLTELKKSEVKIQIAKVLHDARFNELSLDK